MPIGDQDVTDGVFFRPGDVSQVTIVETGAVFYGFFEYPEVLANFSPVQVMTSEVSGKPVLHYATESAPLARGMILDIQGEGRWEVRGTRQDQDGKTSVADLKRP